MLPANGLSQIIKQLYILSVLKAWVTVQMCKNSTMHFETQIINRAVA